MTQEAHELILKLLDEINGKVDGINTRLDAQNGRVRKCESAIAVLRYAVFIAGGGVAGAVGYLFVMHLK